MIDNNKGTYKESFMNNYICKKFISNNKVNLTNIETNKILNYCKYFLLSKNEYFNYFSQYLGYQCYWLLRSPSCNYADSFRFVNTGGITGSDYAYRSYGFVPFFMKRKEKVDKQCKFLKLFKLLKHLKIRNY